MVLEMRGFWLWGPSTLGLVQRSSEVLTSRAVVVFRWSKFLAEASELLQHLIPAASHT